MLFLTPLTFWNQKNMKNYTNVESHGNLPADFTERTSNKVAKDAEAIIKDTDTRHTQSKKYDFILKSNYYIDNLLMSGNVLFGDTISIYVNKVADIILQNEPKLRTQLRFYVVKSNITNAFTTNHGMIFITTGLLAQLENEAQLAFILGHEVTHFKKKHAINTLLESEKIYAKQKYTHSDQDKNIIRLSNYSKSLEIESDSVGFTNVKNAGYDIAEILDVYDVLQFSHLPFNEIDFDFSYFHHPQHDLMAYFDLDTLTPINFEVNEDDSKSSHPNLNKRREKIADFINKENNLKKGKLSILDESYFLSIRDICRFESINLDLKNLNYVKSFYNSKYLLDKYPNNEYLNTILCKALYGIAKFKEEGLYSELFDKHPNYEGSISRYYNFFEKIPHELLTVFAISKMTQHSNQFNSNKLAPILNNLTTNLILKNGGLNFEFDNYFTATLSETPKENNFNNSYTSDSSEISKDAQLGKYNILRSQNKQQQKLDSLKKLRTEIPTNMHLTLYAEQENRNYIKMVFEKNLNQLNLENDKLTAIETERSKMTTVQLYRLDEAERKRNKNEIDAEKIIFIDPQFIVINESYGVKLENSEDERYNLYDYITQMGEKTNLETEILTPKFCDVSDYEKMNHLSYCNDWILENSKLANYKEDWNFIPSNYDKLVKVSEKYNSNNIGITGIIEFKQELDKDPTVLILALFPYTIPFVAAYFLRPSYTSIYYTYIFDAQTGEMKVNQTYFNKRKTNQGVIKSYMYDIFLTMQSK